MERQWKRRELCVDRSGRKGARKILDEIVVTVRSLNLICLSCLSLSHRFT